jgi:hypothetical protein
MLEEVEPLPAELWFDRIQMIERGELASTENALRHAFHLLQLTPREFRPRDCGIIGEADYEALLEAGELEAAARRLVAVPTLTVSTVLGARGTDAAIKCSTLNKIVFGTGETPAAAILQAWAKCFSEWREELFVGQFTKAMRG